jgi:hypothetical protein
LIIAKVRSSSIDVSRRIFFMSKTLLNSSTKPKRHPFHCSRKRGPRLVPRPRIDRPGSRVGNDCGSVLFDGRVPIPLDAPMSAGPTSRVLPRPIGWQQSHAAVALPCFLPRRCSLMIARVRMEAWLESMI